MQLNLRTVVLLTLIASAAAPAAAARKKVLPISDTASTEAGQVFVHQIGKTPMKEAEIVLDELFSRGLTYLARVSQVDETRGTYKADRSRLKLEPGEGHDRIAMVELLVVGDEKAKQQNDPKKWRDVVENVVRGFARSGTVLKFSDGTETRARFGPDDNLIFFMFDYSHFMRNDAGELVMRQYVWEKKEPYLAVVPLYFPVTAASWKTARPTSIRLGDVELNLREPEGRRKR